MGIRTFVLDKLRRRISARKEAPEEIVGYINPDGSGSGNWDYSPMVEQWNRTVSSDMGHSEYPGSARHLTENAIALSLTVVAVVAIIIGLLILIR